MKNPKKTFNKYKLDWRPDRIDIFFNDKMVRSIRDEKVLEEMAQALLDRGGKVETLILSECDHAEASYECGKSNGQWIPKLLKWIDSS